MLVLVRFRYKDGLREGAGEEDEKQTQEGFSNGFHSAYRLLLTSSEIRGRLCALQSLKPNNLNLTLHQQYIKQLAEMEHKVAVQLNGKDYSSENSLLSNIDGSIRISGYFEEYLKHVETYINTISS